MRLDSDEAGTEQMMRIENIFLSALIIFLGVFHIKTSESRIAMQDLKKDTSSMHTEAKAETDSLYTIPVQTMNGEATTLASYQGQVMLIVNVASRCGFTKQYAPLEAMYQKYKDRGFVILGFPCNQFLHQEPGTNAEIKAFAESCYRVSFPLFGKINVKGSAQAPLYQYLQSHLQKKPLKFMPWNFTKILVDNHGTVLRQYAPITSFEKLNQAVEALLTSAPSDLS